MKLDNALSLATARRSVERDRPVSFFEFWPDWLFYLPVVVHWLALGVRHRGVTLPTLANPTITAGGLCGESKREILDLVQAPVRDVLARYTSAIAGDTDIAGAEQAMAAAGIGYPVVAKPDIGCNGSGVRLVRNQNDLARYLQEYPRGERLLLQELVDHEGEAGIFYIRLPGEASGRITSITLKHAPVLVGDGRSTVQQLVLADPRAGKVPHLYLPRLKDRLRDVPRQGERIRLVFVGNHCKGSIFENGAHLATPALAQAFDAIAQAIPGYRFGRIDVRFESLPRLARGEGFRIIEINGAGSEATHIWDPRTTLRDAWRAQFFHYGAAFRIGAANRAAGHQACSVRSLFRLWRRQKRLMATYPLND